MAKENIVIEKPKNVRWEGYTFTDNQTRVFYCNAIVFNNQGTGNCVINNIYTLQPGDTLSLGCDENEVDCTIYGIQFVSGFVNKLGIMAKMNEGVNAIIDKQQMSVSRPMDRRKLTKEYQKRRHRGGF